MPRVLNKNREAVPKDAIYVGRPSKWGNPFEIGADGTRWEVILQHRKWVLSQPELIAAIQKELKGKDLVCFCCPKPCHGNTLLEIANREAPSSP